jgi:hypothetical protein
MRYFNNALGDRRVYIRNSGINPYESSYNTPSTELRRSLTAGKSLREATANNGSNTGNLEDLFSSNTSNTSKLLLSTKLSSSFNSSTTAWNEIGASSVDPRSTDACLPRYSDLSPEMRAHIDKFGEIPTRVGADGKVHVDREALTQRVVDYYAGPEGGSMNLGGFSAERFANAGHDERMSMLRDMRKQNDAAKAAKFEEDLRLAQERDAAKECNNNPAAQSGGDITGKLIATGFSIFETVLPKVLPMLF